MTKLKKSTGDIPIEFPMEDYVGKLDKNLSIKIVEEFWEYRKTGKWDVNGAWFKAVDDYMTKCNLSIPFSVPTALHQDIVICIMHEYMMMYLYLCD